MTSTVEEMVREVYRDAEELANYNHHTARIEADPMAVISLRLVHAELSALLGGDERVRPEPKAVEIAAAQKIHDCMDAIETAVAGTDIADEVNLHVEHVRAVLSEMESPVAVAS
jgi:hypothetical protein